MTDTQTPTPGTRVPPDTLRLAMLQEIYDLGLEAAGDVWPTPAMALARLFERGTRFLEAPESLPRIQGGADPATLEALCTTREDLFLVEALSMVTRHAAFVLTVSSGELEQTWLQRADRHLEIRAEIVERRRDEERLKRELRALGGTAVPLPEHEDLPPAEPTRPRRRRGLFEHLFDGVTLVEVDLDVPESTLRAADAVIHARGWDADWGEHARLLVLTHGISLALREREADAIDPDDDASMKAGQEAARSRLMGLDGRYTTLRRRLFELRHNNRILGWRITALEIEAQGMRRRLDQFLVDRERLEAAIQERRAAGAVIREEEQPPEDSGGWRRRLGRLFKKSE